MGSSHFFFAGALFLAAAAIHAVQETLVGPRTLAAYGIGLVIYGGLKLFMDRRRPG
jgi:hypothetical protein